MNQFNRPSDWSADLDNNTSFFPTLHSLYPCQFRSNLIECPDFGWKFGFYFCRAVLMPKLYLESCWRHHFSPLEQSRQRHTMSDGNVAFEKVAGCCTVLIAPTVRRICVLLTDLLIKLLLSVPLVGEQRTLELFNSLAGITHTVLKVVFVISYPLTTASKHGALTDDRTTQVRPTLLL